MFAVVALVAGRLRADEIAHPLDLPADDDITAVDDDAVLVAA